MTAEEERIERRQRKSLLEGHVKQIPIVQESIKQYTEQVKQVQEHVAKNSQKSSLPPSSDRFSRQSNARDLRTRSGKKPGGHAGHQGHTLQMHAEPTDVIALADVSRCQYCQTDVSENAAHRIERRQAMDVPAPPPLQIKQDEAEGT